MKVNLILCLFILCCDSQSFPPPISVDVEIVDLGSFHDQLIPDQTIPDKHIECYGSLARFCYTGPEGTLNIGVCRDGLSICKDGRWGECLGQVLPGPKVCNGLDNDCDGKPDYIVRECYSGPADTEGVGVCKAGKQVCLRDKWGPCLYEVVPSKEICDGLDNDCNGVVDEYCL